MNRLLRVWLIASVPLALFGLWTLWAGFGGEGHPHPRYDFGGTVEWANVPVWDGSNSIPLSVDSAIRIGHDYLASNLPSSTGWNLQNIVLAKGRTEPWEYELIFGHGSNREFKVELLRVLMNGQVGRMIMK